MKINLYYLICLMLFFSGGCQKDCIETNKPENNIVDADFEIDGFVTKTIIVTDSKEENSITLKFHAKSIERINKHLSINKYILEVGNDNEVCYTDNQENDEIENETESSFNKEGVIIEVFETNFKNENLDFALLVEEQKSNEKSDTYPYKEEYMGPKWYHHAKVEYTDTDYRYGIEVTFKTKYSAFSGWRDKLTVELNPGNRVAEFHYSKRRIAIRVDKNWWWNNTKYNFKYKVYFKHWERDVWGTPDY